MAAVALVVQQLHLGQPSCTLMRRLSAAVQQHQQSLARLGSCAAQLPSRKLHLDHLSILQQLAAAMSSRRSGFRTQAMPASLAAAAAVTTGSLTGGMALGEASQLTWAAGSSLAARRLSSLGCSSSRSAGGRQQPAQRRCRWPAFASINSQQAGTVGQLRWHASAAAGRQQQQQQPHDSGGGSGADSEADRRLSPAQHAPLQQGWARLQPQQMEQLARALSEPDNVSQEELKQLSHADRQQLRAMLKSLVQTATTQDTFKPGDVLAGGRYKLQHILGSDAQLGWAEGMGEGRFNTLWLGQDLSAGGKEVVLKLVEAGDAASYAAGTREAALHAMAGRHPNIVPLLDAFEHRSPAGRHACLVLERCGSNLLYVCNTYAGQDMRHAPAANGRLMPVPQHGLYDVAALRSITRQTLAALDHLHSRGIAHMDVSSDNVLLDKPFCSIAQVLTNMVGAPGGGLLGMLRTAANVVKLNLPGSQPEQQLAAATQAARQAAYTDQDLRTATVKLTDFGRAVPFRQLQQQQDAARGAAAAGAGTASTAAATDAATLLQYNPDGAVVMAQPGLRPPEELLGLPYAGPAYDIWRAGCLLYELAAGQDLFPEGRWARLRKHRPRLAKAPDDELMLLDIVTHLGSIPRKLVRRSPLRSDYFLPSDALRLSNVLEYTPGEDRLAAALQQTDKFSESEALALEEFLSAMLVIDPEERPSAAELLQHKWLAQDAGGGGGK